LWSGLSVESAASTIFIILISRFSFLCLRPPFTASMAPNRLFMVIVATGLGIQALSVSLIATHSPLAATAFFFFWLSERRIRWLYLAVFLFLGVFSYSDLYNNRQQWMVAVATFYEATFHGVFDLMMLFIYANAVNPQSQDNPATLLGELTGDVDFQDWNWIATGVAGVRRFMTENYVWFWTTLLVHPALTVFVLDGSPLKQALYCMSLFLLLFSFGGRWFYRLSPREKSRLLSAQQ